MASMEVIRFGFGDSPRMALAVAIRTRVFVEEQGVPADLEYDGEDEGATHYLLISDGIPIATARWRYKGSGIKLERFAMLPEHRNAGAGRQLLDAVLGDVIPLGRRIYLHSQERAVNFYLRRGFEIEGEAFEEAGIRHFLMVWPQSIG